MRIDEYWVIGRQRPDQGVAEQFVREDVPAEAASGIILAEGTIERWDAVRRRTTGRPQGLGQAPECPGDRVIESLRAPRMSHRTGVENRAKAIANCAARTVIRPFRRPGRRTHDHPSRWAMAAQCGTMTQGTTMTYQTIQRCWNGGSTANPIIRISVGDDRRGLSRRVAASSPIRAK
jgi:hypothetical protein